MMERRFSVPHLFLYTVAISVSFLVVYYTVTMHYKTGFSNLAHQIHLRRSAIQRQPSPKVFQPPTLMNPASDGNHFLFNKLISPHHQRHPRFSVVKLYKGFNKAKYFPSVHSTSSTHVPNSTISFERQEYPASVAEKIKPFQITGQNMLQYPATETKHFGNHISKNIKQNQSIHSLIDPHKRYLKRGFTGRLGNVLFEFASAFCIAKLNNLTLILKDVKELQNFRYQGIRVPKNLWSQLSLSPITTHWPGSCCGFNPHLMTLKPANYNHALITYFQSWKFFEPCKTEVKRAIAFSDAVIGRALSIMAVLRNKLPHRTLVGVHVRMEDYLKPLSKFNGKRVAPPAFYHRAMTYFRSQFHDVSFIVITSNPKWFRNNVTSASDVMMLPRSDSPEVDMEVLSRMDHIIFSVGTFGWWAAYKNNGTVICFKDFYVPGSRYGRQFWNNGMDYFYPGWILM